MAISEAYQDTLKRRALTRFIEAEGRGPTIYELRDLVQQEQRNYPSVDQVGISGFDIVKPQFKKFSSASEENTSRKAVFDDMYTLRTRLNDLTQLLEDEFRGFQGTSRRMYRLLSELETRADTLLLLNSNVDVFVHGVQETFDTQENIDVFETTASIESNYCTLGRTGYNVVDLDDVRLSASVLSDQGIIGSQTTSPIEHLKEDDGALWEYLVYTKTRQGRVSVVLEFEFPEPTYVGDVRITGSGMSVNQSMTSTLFYSLDGQTYTAYEPVETVFEQGENLYSLGKEGVRKIQLIFSKNVSDNVTTTANQYIYVFSFDSIKFFTDQYVPSKRSTLVAGPYEITDEEGEAVLFTKATLSACVTTPEDTSINFFLSKDKTTWIPVNNSGQSFDIISFADGSKTGTEVFVDESTASGILVETIPGVEEIDFQTEAWVSIGIDSDFGAQVPLRSIELRRNLPSTDSTEKVYRVPRGWFQNAQETKYRTTIEIDAPEGRFMDVGSTGLLVNGTLVTGQVHLNEGFSTIETNDSNWLELPEGLTTETDLIDADPLYPFNHKYLIEGYNYPAGFKGEKVYTGVDAYFGSLLKYIPPERFSALEGSNTEHFDLFTIEDIDGNRYFKVKVDKMDSTWKDELFSVDWLVQSGEDNNIYVRADLETSNTEVTPIIQKFNVRVI